MRNQSYFHAAAGWRKIKLITKLYAFCSREKLWALHTTVSVVKAVSTKLSDWFKDVVPYIFSPNQIQESLWIACIMFSHAVLVWLNAMACVSGTANTFSRSFCALATSVLWSFHLLTDFLITFYFQVLFRLGEVLDPQAKLYLILYGDRGESGKIYLTPSDGTKFESGKQYRVSVNIKDIGKVKSSERKTIERRFVLLRIIALQNWRPKEKARVNFKMLAPLSS